MKKNSIDGYDGLIETTGFIERDGIISRDGLGCGVVVAG